jgi:hypothetical protein
MKLRQTDCDSALWIRVTNGRVLQQAIMNPVRNPWLIKGGEFLVMLSYLSNYQTRAFLY